MFKILNLFVLIGTGYYSCETARLFAKFRSGKKV
jgi:hypothetical protein